MLKGIARTPTPVGISDVTGIVDFSYYLSLKRTPRPPVYFPYIETRVPAVYPENVNVFGLYGRMATPRAEDGGLLYGFGMFTPEMLLETNRRRVGNLLDAPRNPTQRLTTKNVAGSNPNVSSDAGNLTRLPSKLDLNTVLWK